MLAQQTQHSRETLLQSSSGNPKAVSEVSERMAMLRWSSFIILLLGGSVGMWIYAAVLAVSDPSMAVVPDYHEKALQWDKQVAINSASQALGWSVHVILGASENGNAMRVVTLFIRDKDAQPVTGANGTLRIYHHARAGQSKTVALKEAAPGAYEVDVPMDRTGIWQLEVKLDRGADHFEWADAHEFSTL